MSSPAHGKETSALGADQRCSPWLPHGCGLIAYSLLGRAPVISRFHGRRFEWPFLLAKVQFPIIGVDFLRHFKLLVDPVANRLVDTVSTQLLPAVSSVRSQPEPAETSAMAAATPVGRPAKSQVHVGVLPPKLSLVAARVASPPGL